MLIGITGTNNWRLLKGWRHEVVSVDLRNTYFTWAKGNFALNNLSDV